MLATNTRPTNALAEILPVTVSPPDTATLEPVAGVIVTAPVLTILGVDTKPVVTKLPALTLPVAEIVVLDVIDGAEVV